MIFLICLLETLIVGTRYNVEPRRRGGSNEYPQSMFSIKNKKNGPVLLIKVSYEGVYFHRRVFLIFLFYFIFFLILH